MEFPISVFLDSNQFISSKYNFGESSPLGILQKMVELNKIKVYTSEIVVQEVVKHIEEDTKKAVNRVLILRSELNKLVSRELTSGTHFDSVFANFDKVAIIAKHKAKFHKFLIDSKIEVLNCEGVEVQGIINDYFNTIPPFQPGENKKFEFPDAIMSHKIKKIFGEANPLIVVSSDNGFKKSFIDLPGISTSNDIREVFNLINKTEVELYSMILHITQTEDFELDFTESLVSRIKSTENIVNGLDCDRKGICSGYQYDNSEIMQVNIIEFNLKTLNVIQNDIFNVSIMCKVEIEAYCSFDDYDQAIFDKEDGKYFNVESVSIIEHHIDNIECDVDIKILKPKDKIIATIEDIDFSLELDSYTLKDRKYYNPKIDDEHEAESLDILEDYCKH